MLVRPGVRIDEQLGDRVDEGGPVLGRTVRRLDHRLVLLEADQRLVDRYQHSVVVADGLGQGGEVAGHDRETGGACLHRADAARLRKRGRIRPDARSCHRGMQLGLAHAASHENAACLAACALEQVVEQHLVAAQPVIVARRSGRRPPSRSRRPARPREPAAGSRARPRGGRPARGWAARSRCSAERALANACSAPSKGRARRRRTAGCRCERSGACPRPTDSGARRGHAATRRGRRPTSCARRVRASARCSRRRGTRARGSALRSRGRTPPAPARRRPRRPDRPGSNARRDGRRPRRRLPRTWRRTRSRRARARQARPRRGREPSPTRPGPCRRSPQATSCSQPGPS